MEVFQVRKKEQEVPRRFFFFFCSILLGIDICIWSLLLLLTKVRTLHSISQSEVLAEAIPKICLILLECVRSFRCPTTHMYHLPEHGQLSILTNVPALHKLLMGSLVFLQNNFLYILSNMPPLYKLLRGLLVFLKIISIFNSFLSSNSKYIELYYPRMN